MGSVHARVFALAGGVAALTSCSAIWGIQLLPAGPSDAGTDSSAFVPDTTGDLGTGEDTSLLPPSEASADSSGEAAADAPAEADGMVPECICVGAPPAGWSGPVAFSTASSGTLPPLSCSSALGSMAYSGLQNPDGQPAQCTCACGAPQGGACGAHLTYYNNPCGMTLGGCNQQDFGLEANACVELTTIDGACAGTVVKSFGADYSQVTAGSCAPSSSMSVAPVTWATTAIACASPTPWTAGTCSATQLCAPTTEAQSENMCLMAAGIQSCAGLPAPYVVQHVAYTGAVDARGCGACACGQPTPQCDLGGTANFFSDPGCTVSVGSRAVSSASSTCYSLPGSSYYATYSPGTNLPGSCTPSGGAPTGGVTPDATMATTFCCAQ